MGRRPPGWRDMATRKSQLLEALQNGDRPEDLICFVQEHEGPIYLGEQEVPPVRRCTFNELPEREFDDGFGGPEGEPCIAFSDRFVYICVQYDGAEHMEAIPRNPEDVDGEIPWPGD